MKLSLSNMQSAITRQEIARRVIDARALKVDEIIRRLSVGDIAGRGAGGETERIHDSNENCFLSWAGG